MTDLKRGRTPTSFRGGASAPYGAGRRTLKVVLFTGYSCNNRCGFCIDYDKRQISDRTTQSLMREMAFARAWGAEYLELIGGEATLRTDFLPLVRAARRLGFREIATATNGRRFAYLDFAREAIRAGLTCVIFSIHGHNEAAHDGLTAAPGSFKQLTQGIENLRGLGFGNIHANTTVVRQNQKFLPEIGRLYLDWGVRGAEIIFVDPTYGGAHRSFERFVPRISEAAPWMRACLDVGRAAGIRDWSVRYVPLCHFTGYEDQVSETMERRVFRTIHVAPDFRNMDVSASRAAAAREKPAACAGCRLYEECEGLWKEYLCRYGAAELRPPR